MAGTASAPTRSNTSRPLTPPSCTSRKSTSGACRVMASTAEAPSPHSATISASGSAISCCLKASRPGGSSSTSTTFTLVLGPEGELEPDRGAPRGEALQLEPVGFTIEFLQSGPGVRETDSISGSTEARPIIGEFEPESISSSLRLEPHHCPAERPLDPMLHRIFHQRLQHESGNQSVRCLSGHVEIDREPVSKAHPLDLEIGRQYIQLLRQ